MWMDVLAMFFLAIPGGIALMAAWGAVVLFNALEKARPGARIVMWIGIVALGTLAFGIGSCYAAFIHGGGRIH